MTTPDSLNEAVERLEKIAANIDKSGRWHSFVNGLYVNDPRQPAAAWAADLRAILAELAALKEDIRWIAAFAQVRSQDDSKVFARVNRGALRTIADRARDLLSRLDGGRNGCGRTQERPSPSLADEACEPSSGVARWRCTRCGRDEIDCQTKGCARGPCPMEFIG